MNHSDYEALDADEVAACPECDATQINVKCIGSIPGPNVDDKKYTCSKCSTRFDDPIIRDRHGKGGPTRGMAKDLLDADPDEVSR